MADNERKYLYHQYTYVGDAKYLYVWYEQNGVRRMEKKLVSEVAKPRADKPSKPMPNFTPKKTLPGHIPTFDYESKSIAIPDLKKAERTNYRFIGDEEGSPVRERFVPQPPPIPGIVPYERTKEEGSVTKYEYTYGIKNLEIKHTQYGNNSVYVSKPINVEGNVMQVSLEAIEEHPIFDTLNGQAADRQTSVEYYIASTGVNPSPTLDDWLPILPESQKTVKSELIIFEAGGTASLRFPALIGSKERPVMYKNGIKMADDEWAFAQGGYKIQLFVERDPTAIYTIDYTPNSEFYNPWVIDLSKAGGKPIHHTEVFETGTNHNKTIVLEKYPYIDYEKINTTKNFDPNAGDYVPIKVTLRDADIVGQNRVKYREVLPYDGTDKQYVFTKNMTNYKTGAEPELRPYSIDLENPYNGFEYYQEGNKLYFTETFNHANIHTNYQESHGNAKIVVDYEYLSSDFRMKIILRRNSTDENTLTPIVHEYTLKFKVMK